MKKIEQILREIHNVFERLGFRKERINDEINYVYGELYCIPHYIRQIGFFIEYAASYEQALHGLHTDGDSFRLDVGEGMILKGIEKEVLTEMGRQNK